MKSRLFAFASVVPLVIALGSNTVRADDLTWTGSVSTDWNNLTNWTPQKVPAASDHVSINSGNVTIPAAGVFAVMDWTGGTISGSLTVANAAVLNLSGSGGKELQAALTIASGGTVNWGGTGYLRLWNNNTATYQGSITNQAGGLFNIQNDQSVQTVYGFETFTNAGTVRKSAGTGPTAVGLPFTNTGTLEAQTGTISLNSGGSLGGLFVAAADAAIVFNTGSFPLVGGNPSSSGLGTVRFGTSAVITFSAPITNFNFTAGSITGDTQVTGTLNWTGGTISGSLTVANAAVLNVSGSSGKELQAALTIASGGTVNWDGTGYLRLWNNNSATYKGAISNVAGGLFNIMNDQSVQTVYGSETFTNAGTVRKSAGTGTTAVGLPFANAGTLEAQTGTISLNGGGSLGGLFVAAADAAIVFNTGSFPLVGANPANSGLGTVRFGASAVITFSAPITNFNFTAGSITGDTQVTGTLNWTGGTISGSLTVANAAVLNVSGSSGKELQAALTIASGGTVNWDGTGYLRLWNNNSATYKGAINNVAGGLFNIMNDQSLLTVYNSETFTNAGTVRKSAGTGTTAVGLPFANAGTLEAQTGTISLNGGGSLGGLFVAAADATIIFNTGSFPLVGANPANSGLGTVRFGASAVITFSAPITNFNFTAGSITGDTQVTGMFNWTGGTISGPMTVANAAVLNVSGSSGKELQAALTIASGGTVNWDGTGYLRLQNNNTAALRGAINNLAGGLFNIMNDQSLLAVYNSETFANAGTVRKSAGAGTTTFNFPFTNTGTLEAQTGTISLNNGGSLGGLFVAAAGATIIFNTGSFPLVGANPASSGPGTVQFGGGANITFNGPITNFNFTTGSITGDTQVAGMFNWTGGTISGPMTVANAAVLNVSGSSGKELQAALTIASGGTANWDGTGYLRLWNNNTATYKGAINNLAGGLFNIMNDQSLLTVYNSESFTNGGTVRKSPGTGMTTFPLAFTNTGTVEGQTGTLSFTGGYSNTASADLAISVGSAVAGSGYGKISFSTPVSFDGTFTVSARDGFLPNPGSAFQVLSYPSATNLFTCLRGLDLGGGRLLQPEFDAKSLTLRAAGYTINASQPRLFINPTRGGVALTWPVGFPGWTLQSTTDLSSSVWLPVSHACGNQVIVPFSALQQYFRFSQ